VDAERAGRKPQSGTSGGGESPAVDDSILPAPADYKWRHSGLPGTAVSSTQTKGNASPATGNLW